MSNGKIITEYISKSGVKLRRCSTHNEEASLTSQADAKEADVNHIMSKYIKTGISPEFRSSGVYSDVSEIPDLESMLTTINKAQTAFDALDSKTREYFNNSPVNMINFLQDENNRSKAEELGLINPKPLSQTVPTSSSN